MEFIKRMKKREFIEMGLKTAMAVLFGIILIFAMEAMIYGIHIKMIKKSDSTFASSPASIEYYIEKVNKDSYNVFKVDRTKGKLNWHVNQKVTKARLDDMLYKGGEMRKFNARLYKIEVNDNNVLTDYEYDTDGNKGAFEKVKELYAEAHENVSFNVFTKADADAEYVKAYSDKSYDELYTMFYSKGGEIGDNSQAKVYWRAPNCFDIYMNWAHYLVMVIFLLIIGGVYAWRFTLIAKEYKKIEKKFKKTGKVFN